ncbi:shikimate kinase [Candidatus Micrarchaeota archaeon]|nr:shikimate kinase [Candidatus Micrarchaeota archaeon]
MSTSDPIVPADRLKPNVAILDAFYVHKTKLVEDGEKKGCKIIPGSEWLLYQGTKAFELFTGKPAPVEVMRDALSNKQLIQMPSSNKTNIALIGFMGSGKTTIAKVLSQKLKRKLVDIDKSIEEKAQRSISDLFAESGEAEFRKLESEQISALKQAKNSVIACGGGCVVKSENIQSLRQNCFVVWLWATPTMILSRIKDDNSRPLISFSDREQRIVTILQSRLPLYASAADIVISTEDKTPEEIARLIAEETGECNE